MNKRDLKDGMVLELRNGLIVTIDGERIILLYGHLVRNYEDWGNLDNYTDDLTSKTDRDYDFIRLLSTTQVPEEAFPEQGDIYYFIDLNSCETVHKAIWYGANDEYRMYYRGVIFSNEQKAAEYVDEILGWIKRQKKS